MIFVGIDPGAKGGYGILGGSEGSAIAYPYDRDDFLWHMRALAEKERERPGSVFCCMEKVAAMPKQGVTSTFHFGESFGFLQGVLTALHIPFQLVPPRKWKGAFSLGSDKGESVAACRRMFPEVNLLATPRCKKPHDGMAEGLILAAYARRIYGENQPDSAQNGPGWANGGNNVTGAVLLEKDGERAEGEKNG